MFLSEPRALGIKSYLGPCEHGWFISRGTKTGEVLTHSIEWKLH